MRRRGRRWRPSHIVTVLLVVAGAALVPGEVNAESGFGSYATPEPHYVSRLASITHGSSELNQSHRDFFSPYFLWMIESEYDNRTALTVNPSSSNTAYVYWYAAPVPRSNSNCGTYANRNSNPPSCSRAYVELAEAITQTPLELRSLISCVMRSAIQSVSRRLRSVALGAWAAGERRVRAVLQCRKWTH